MKYEPLILIGAAKDCFDGVFNLLHKQLFQYLFVKERNQPIHALLMINHNPYEFDVEGLLHYMQEKDLSGIEVYGGGLCEPTSGYGYIQIFSESPNFKKVHLQRAYEFFKQSWAFKTVDVTRITSISKEDLSYHRYYSMDEIILIIKRIRQQSM